MKLCVFLMLAAIPLCCHAGSGCQGLEDVISAAINPNVSKDGYQDVVKPYVTLSATREAGAQMKQCFLDQSNETLANVKVMMEAIYNSEFCAVYSP
ncbi:mammaglobin-A-like [Thomomys bottae]